VAAVIGELLVNLRASTAAFAKDLDKASQIAFNNAKAIERSFKLIGGATLAVGTTIAAFVAHSIQERGDTPFLHAYADNRAAIALYDNLGFVIRTQIAVQAFALDDHIPQVNTDAKAHLTMVRQLGVLHFEFVLDLHCAAHSIDHTRELQQQTIAGGLHNAPAVGRNRRVNLSITHI